MAEQRTTLGLLMDRIPGLQEAILAIGWFRHRHDRQPKYKSGKRKAQMVKVNSAWYRAQCRRDIARARAKGWRGSVRDTIRRLSQEVDQ